MIELSIPVRHLRISNGIATIELLTPTEARDHLHLNEYTFARYQRLDPGIPSHPVGRTFLYLRHELDNAKELEGSPLREHHRMISEKIEEVIRA
jgi:hypothetical protein